MVSQENQERRKDVRVVGGGRVEAMVIDDSGQPVQMLERPRLISVSAGGLALSTRSIATQGSRVVLWPLRKALPGVTPPKVELEALECSRRGEAEHRVRLRLVQGRMPAQLIHGW